MSTGEWLKSLYRDFNDGDGQAVLARFSDRAVMEHVTTGRTFRGHEELPKGLAFWQEHFSSPTVDLDSVEVVPMSPELLKQFPSATEGYEVTFEGVADGVQKAIVLKDRTEIAPFEGRRRLPITERMWIRKGEIVYATNEFVPDALTR